MHDVLSSVKNLIKLQQRIRIDNNVFKLHYKFTVIMLIFFSVLLSSKQYFGDPIDCDTEGRVDFINVYCWIHGTHIINNEVDDPKLSGLGNNNDKITTTQTYYQWVCLLFCLQALAFYIPKYLWKTWEGGRISILVKDIGGPLVNDNWTVTFKHKLINHLMSGKKIHNIYALRFAFCEILNLINVVGQMFFIDWYLSGKFSLYGMAVINKAVANPMDTVFPKVTKCSYFRYGASGSQETRDALCILSLNILNEKFFLILWFWMFILIFISVFAMAYRLFFIFSCKFRMYFLRALVRDIEVEKVKFLTKALSYGEFFLLYRIGKNVNPIVFKDLVTAMYETVRHTKPNYSSFKVEELERA